MENTAEEVKNKATEGFSKIFKEGKEKVAETIEKARAEVPKDKYLWLAVGVLGVAFTLQGLRQKHVSLLVGQLVPSLLGLAIYNKLVKHDQNQNRDKTVDTGKTETFGNYGM